MFERLCCGQIIRVSSITSADCGHSGEDCKQPNKNYIPTPPSAWKATPPPENPEVSVPETRRFIDGSGFILKGPVYDVNFPVSFNLWFGFGKSK